jgi:hypothetical protein
LAKVYRKHRYHGLKYMFSQFNRSLISLSRPLGIILTISYLLIPWFLQIGDYARNILLAIGLISGGGAYWWHRNAGKLRGTMDIIAAGHDGEGTVAKLLAKLPRNWAVLNDLALRAGGPIVQIDHIVISPGGIRVIETKAQKGQIVSSPEAGQWKVKRRGEVRTIVNPVEQNQAQVEACRLLLGKMEVTVPCEGLVVMTESSAKTNWPIVMAPEVNTTLLLEASQNPVRMNARQMRSLAKSLLKFQVTGKAPWQKGSQHLRLFALTILLPLAAYLVALTITL